MKRSTIALTIALAALWAFPHFAGAESRPRSIPVLDQSEPRGPFYFQIFTGIRAELDPDTCAHTSLFAENLDLGRFNGRDYEESLQHHLKQMYRDSSVGVIVAGMGIGLSIARTIVQAHRGRIWAENETEAGAVFLSLPLAVP